jgi:rhodanese-related sulfurtransferase
MSLQELNMKTINVKQLADKQRSESIDLIDVRMPVEFREVHAVGAKNYPLDALDPKSIATSRNGRSAEPIYVICKSGNRSSKAAQKFIDAGIDNVYSVEGGTTAWEQAGLPVKRGKKAISLERQVRIAAGFLALLGSSAGLLRPSVLHGTLWLHRRRTDVCRNHRYLRHGNDA